jgi:hypothetical protein
VPAVVLETMREEHDAYPMGINRMVDYLRRPKFEARLGKITVTGPMARRVFQLGEMARTRDHGSVPTSAPFPL